MGISESQSDQPPYGQKPDYGLFVGIFFGIVSFFFFVLQSNGVEVNWQLSALIYVICTVALVWTLSAHALPGKGKKALIAVIPLVLLCVVLGFVGTAKQFHKDHFATESATAAPAYAPKNQASASALGRSESQTKISPQNPPVRMHTETPGEALKAKTINLATEIVDFSEQREGNLFILRNQLFALAARETALPIYPRSDGSARIQAQLREGYDAVPTLSWPIALDCISSVEHDGGSPFGLLRRLMLRQHQLPSSRSNGQQPIETSQLEASASVKQRPGNAGRSCINDHRRGNRWRHLSTLATTLGGQV